jgi:translocation and assembly module TamB
MSWREGSLASELHFDQTAQQHNAARATLPIALNLEPRAGERVFTLREDTLEATLEAKRFDVGWFQPLISPRVVRKLDGSIDGSVRVSGSPREPRFEGTLALTRAKAQVPPLGTTFEARQATLAFRSRTIELQPAVVTSGGGRVELSGTATVDGPGHRSLDSRANFSKFQLMNTALAHVEVNGNLAVTGPLDRPALSGALELANSTLYLEGGQSDRRLESVELSEDDWRQLDARFSESDAAVKRPFAELTDSSSVDVTVKMGRNVWVRRRSDPIVALELSGQVRAMRQPGAAPQLAGQLDVETGRSYLSFLNRRFDMTRAQVDLPGPLALAHAELEAQYLPGTSSNNSSTGPDVTAVVTLGAEGARVDLHSTPFMDHASLINYLATGQTQGEMSSGTAYGLAVGTVLGSVGGSARRSLGLDVVQVTQDAYGGQTLAAGSHVKPELYLGFRQPVVQGQQNSSRGENSTYTTEFEVEVEAGRQMLLNLQGGGSQYRFLIRPRLGK